jgi:hypothetical protein
MAAPKNKSKKPSGSGAGARNGKLIFAVIALVVAAGILLSRTTNLFGSKGGEYTPPVLSENETLPPEIPADAPLDTLPDNVPRDPMNPSRPASAG